jgi:hypothetical protein
MSNPSIEEIFDDKNFSARFYLYQKDTSPRGESLYCCQILTHLKRSFPNQTAIIDHAITQIRQLSLESEEEQRKKILRALRSFAATIEEISEETFISRPEVEKILKLMVKEKTVKTIQHPTSQENYRDRLWFEIKT